MMDSQKTIFVVRGDKRLLQHQKNKAFLCREDQAYDDDDGASQVSFYGDHGTPPPTQPPAEFLRITTDHIPKDIRRGFTIGRNPAVCDIVLNDPQVSEKHLAVSFNWKHRTVVLRNDSRHGTLAQFFKHGENCRMKSSRALLEYETVEIYIGNLQIQIQRLGDPVGWKQFCAQRTQDLSSRGLSTDIGTANATQPPVYLQDYRLGQGAFAQVFRSVEKYTGDVYAMKLYDRPDKARWQELATLESLRHEHIVRYVAYIHLPGQPAQLIMEHLDGPNLQDMLDPRNGHPPLSMAEARQLLLQLLQAASYLHQKGVTHRDIKPANIILVHRHPIHVKLVDFGLATSADIFDTHCGTPLYAAPEIRNTRAKLTNKVDMFSIGVVALRLLGFSPRIEGVTSSAACLDAVWKQKQALAARGHPLAADLVCRLLSESPADRPAASSCLGHLFFQSDASLIAPPGPRTLAPPRATGAAAQHQQRNSSSSVSNANHPAFVRSGAPGPPSAQHHGSPSDRARPSMRGGGIPAAASSSRVTGPALHSSPEVRKAPSLFSPPRASRATRTSQEPSHRAQAVAGGRPGGAFPLNTC